MPSKKDSALDKVQNLYLMQVELWNFLDDTDTDPEKVKHAEKTLREFKALLKEVDWRVMGGEDVLQSLQMIPTEVSQKLKSAPVRKRAAKRAAAKNTGKKPVSKKKK